jgi:hypothetical protein
MYSSLAQEDTTQTPSSVKPPNINLQIPKRKLSLKTRTQVQEHITLLKESVRRV